MRIDIFASVIHNEHMVIHLFFHNLPYPLQSPGATLGILVSLPSFRFACPMLRIAFSNTEYRSARPAE